jgi:ferrochelatase
MITVGEESCLLRGTFLNNMNGIGLVIINLGSPDSYQVADVRTYLRQFLMDERVIDAPHLIRKLIVEGFVLPFRPKKSAKAYASVWMDEGAPLKVLTQRFTDKVRDEVPFPVTIAMRYANPNPEAALKDLQAMVPDLHTILLAPMYPHYAMSSYETALLYVREAIEKYLPEVTCKVLQPFYKDERYIQNLATSIRPYVDKPFDRLLFSYHGLPVRHLKKTDPTKQHCYQCINCCTTDSTAWNTCYKHQVTVTSQLTAKELGLAENQYSISFQSRLGRDEWLKPFTVERLENLPKEGVKKLLIVCPAFVADCLETLEEIAEAGRETFMEAGGESFTVIPCLNDAADWVRTFSDYCRNHQTTAAHLWK